ncbi:MAG: tyrosine-type recombinase/integrase [Candidatus Micrarchaeaceae archaeon]
MQEKTRKTAYFLTDMRNIDKNIYDIITQAMSSSKVFRNKQLFFQYVVFLYLSGSRRIEPFLSKPFIATWKQNIKGKTVQFYKINRINAKHFVKPSYSCPCGFKTSSKESIVQHCKAENTHYTISGKRAQMSAIFKINNPYERALLDFLMQGRQELSFDFTPLLPKSFIKMPQDEREAALLGTSAEKERFIASMTAKFRMFKTRITDGRKAVDYHLLPHMLRHLRAYCLLINYGLPPELVRRLLGWTSKAMVDYYAEINAAMQEKEEIAIYEQMI